MPGIIGFIGKTFPMGEEKFLKDMAQALDSGERSCIDLYHEDKMGLGRVSLGIVNPEPQPIWNADKTLCLVMEGELYDTAALKKDLLQRGYQFKLDNDPELVLNLYQEYGNGFALKLNGAFVLAIWDRIAKKLTLVNDRLGLYPLYYAKVNGGAIFASGVRALLADPSIPRQIDLTAIAEFLTFDHILYDHTLIEAARLLPQASILVIADGQINIQQYWKVKYADPYPLRTEDEYIEEFSHLIRQAVTRQATRDRQSAGVLLSGGLDSRVILAYLVESAASQPVHAFTWGIPGCDDLRYAREIAAITGARHHFFRLESDWLLKKAEEAVRITDGMGNLINLHAFAPLDAETEYAKVIYKGFLGDAMMGFGLRHEFWANYDAPTTLWAHLQAYTEQGLITFTLEEQKKLFTESFHREVKDSVLDELMRGMTDSGSALLADQRNYFDFLHRVPRMTIKGVEVVRNRAIVRLPYSDNDLVEFSLTVPPGLRYDRRLAKNAFVRAFPKLAKVPTTETGLPMITCTRDVLIRASQVIRWHLKSAGISGGSRKPYANYSHWFRTNLRDWVEGILLSDQSLQRGYYNPDYLRNLVTEHMSGANHKIKLGSMLSIELWHRLFID